MSEDGDTQTRILRAALELANDRGVDAVTIRAVARELGISPGNVSYHFAKREDLILALAAELSARNEPLGEMVPLSFGDLLERYRRTLQHQYDHRGIVIAWPHLVETYASMRRDYRATERTRMAQQRRQLAHLRDLGRLDADDDTLDRLVAHIALVARFWLAEYRTTFDRWPIGDVISHYLSLIAGLLLPYAAETGREELRPYLLGQIHPTHEMRPTGRRRPQEDR